MMEQLYCMGSKTALMLNIIQDFILFRDLNLSNWHRQILTKSGWCVGCWQWNKFVTLYICECWFWVPCYHFILGTVNNISRPVPKPFLIDHSTNEFKNENEWCFWVLNKRFSPNHFPIIMIGNQEECCRHMNMNRYVLKSSTIKSLWLHMIITSFLNCATLHSWLYQILFTNLAVNTTVYVPNDNNWPSW